MELEEIRLDVAGRLAAACDVPDLELFPACYPGIQTVHFSAALEFGVSRGSLGRESESFSRNFRRGSWREGRNASQRRRGSGMVVVAFGARGS